MSSKKVLVTGGAGFIGSHTVVELLNQGHEILIADDLSYSRPEVIDSIFEITGTKPEFVKIDLCNQENCSALFEQFKPAAVVHFAAKKLVGESVLNPLLYYRNNLVSLMNVIDGALKTKCKNIVFSSSCTVYSQPDVLPVDENSPRKEAESPYGNTKKIAEDILADVMKVEDLKVISLRYFNPVGAHDSALIGEYPLGAPANLMPVLTQAAIGKRPGFSVFGNDYNTPDGSCIRDYIHVVDIAKAHVKALERLFIQNRKMEMEVFNLGTGKGVSVFEIINCFEKTNQLKLNYTIAERRKGDVEKVWADTKKANEVLGWKAEKTLEDMVSSAWAWEKKLSMKKVS